MRALIFMGLLAACSGSVDDTAITPLPTEEQDASPADAAPLETSIPDVSVPEDTSAPDGASPPMDAPVMDAGSPCRTSLASKGVPFKTTMARGVVDALNVTGPINGVLFASGTETKPFGDPVACEFVQTLVKFADLLKSKGFVRVGTLGSYCYRCCCAWSMTNYCRDIDDPEPDCSANGYSNHSWGRAIDIRYLYKADGTRYDINDTRHWVQSSQPTCTTALAAQMGISKELYTVACDATSMKIFAVALTPNYNSAHRNHWHMDIGRTGTPTSWSTKFASDPGFRTDAPPAWFKDDHCGE